jgi:endo-1,4-beta-D-glucanase Y
MGTDIYLVWDAETKGQREKQHYEEFVPKGKVGYLRANVWSVNENYALSQIFPEKYWRASSPVGRETPQSGYRLVKRRTAAAQFKYL